MGAKIHQKAIKRGGQHGKASWHRFFIDFGGFGEPSWEAKSSQDAQKWHRKNDGKKKGSKIAKKLEKVPAEPSDRRGPRPWGEVGEGLKADEVG